MAGFLQLMICALGVISCPANPNLVEDAGQQCLSQIEDTMSNMVAPNTISKWESNLEKQLKTPKFDESGKPIINLPDPSTDQTLINDCQTYGETIFNLAQVMGCGAEKAIVKLLEDTPNSRGYLQNHPKLNVVIKRVVACKYVDKKNEQA